MIDNFHPLTNWGRNDPRKNTWQRSKSRWQGRSRQTLKS